MASRYELGSAGADPGGSARPQGAGRPTIAISSIEPWDTASGARWSDLPERIFHQLVADKKNQYLMIDSTIVRAHQQAATAARRGHGQGSKAFPRRSDDQDSPVGQATGSADGWTSVSVPDKWPNVPRQSICWVSNQDMYKHRSRIERTFARLKQFRHFATRYEKSKTCFQALVALACS